MFLSIDNLGVRLGCQFAHRVRHCPSDRQLITVNTWALSFVNVAVVVLFVCLSRIRLDFVVFCAVKQPLCAPLLPSHKIFTFTSESFAKNSASVFGGSVVASD